MALLKLSKDTHTTTTHIHTGKFLSHTHMSQMFNSYKKLKNKIKMFNKIGQIKTTCLIYNFLNFIFLFFRKIFQ